MGSADASDVEACRARAPRHNQRKRIQPCCLSRRKTWETIQVEDSEATACAYLKCSCLSRLACNLDAHALIELACRSPFHGSSNLTPRYEQPSMAHALAMSLYSWFWWEGPGSDRVAQLRFKLPNSRDPTRLNSCHRLFMPACFLLSDQV